jgi:hypothetical protein
MIIIIMLVQSLIFNSLFADERSYVWTYEYQTVPTGVAEIEHYLTIRNPSDSLSVTDFSLELEIGMNDRFDFALYQNFRQGPDQIFRYEGFKLRFRYKIGEKNQYFLDPLLYLEYVGTPNFNDHEIEGKLILAKNYGPWNIVINPIVEFEMVNQEWESNLGYAIGGRFSINTLLRIGVEMKGISGEHYLGPVISHGKDGLWVALGSGFAISPVQKGTPKILLRLMIGIEP